MENGEWKREKRQYKFFNFSKEKKKKQEEREKRLKDLREKEFRSKKFLAQFFVIILMICAKRVKVRVTKRKRRAVCDGRHSRSVFD